jgi:hypothetical protein
MGGKENGCEDAMRPGEIKRTDAEVKEFVRVRIDDI